MRIAFYAPLKSPNHPVPSGDRQMARLLIQALERAGHVVEIASELRSFSAMPDAEHYAATYETAMGEVARLSEKWNQTPPDIWFCYHPYYKAPDYLGSALSERFGLPRVTAEASYSARRGQGVWLETQELVRQTIRKAALNICFTDRDLNGIKQAEPNICLAKVSPFIKVGAKLQRTNHKSMQLVTVAMMRPGDKLQSYRMLAEALGRIPNLPWKLNVVGGGECVTQVQAMFEGFGDRVAWVGQVEPEDVPAMLAKSDLYVWPGFGEAFGLAYLEAQAAGLPVVAQDIAGVPEVVKQGETGILTPPEDVEAFASAIASLIVNREVREHMSRNAADFVRRERSLEAASARIDELLVGAVASQRGAVR